ncbi:MAG: MBL fold metallo-hydrolase [Acidaminococcus sp.]|nr:MBL fold metallo-hydrolase [Acidaminococcus sp.]MCI2116785.1 MBL fold metallo-hydrolase [Acidaminococcus sp.]
MKRVKAIGMLLIPLFSFMAPIYAQAQPKSGQTSYPPRHEDGTYHSPAGRMIMERGVDAYYKGDYEKALRYLQNAYARGNMKAGRYIGLCYENGYGVPQDDSLAAHWYTEASQKGDVTSTYLLGMLYEQGKGVPQDAQKAFALYKQSAYRDDNVSAPSQLALGRLYENGIGVEKDLAKARYWYGRAEKAGSREGTVALFRLDGNENHPVRTVTTRITEGSLFDIKDGVTQIDTSKIWTPVKNIDFSSKHQILIQNPDGTKTPMDEPWYEVHQIAPHTWQIRSDGDYCYLLEGDALAVMIDCGYGAGNIREFAQTLTAKPVKYVINTHYHFDHTANDAYFDAAFMTRESVPYATVPYNSFKGMDVPRNYPVITVTDGYMMDLGNRPLSVIVLPHSNHTLGGLMVLDKKEGILFTGDEFLRPSGVSLSIPFEDFVRNMERIHTDRPFIHTLYGGTGRMALSVFDTYYEAARYGASGKAQIVINEHPETRRMPSSNLAPGETPVYVRGQVRPGDSTVNAPEPAPQGKHVYYTYHGFKVSYIIPDNAKS